MAMGCEMSKHVVSRFDQVSFLQAVSRTIRRGWGHKLGVALATLALGSSLYAPVAMGQVISEPRAPIQFRPKISTSGNGVPVVDITKPSFGGISHNKFNRYDVDTRGVILNNSKLTGTSIIGGKVVANPNLAGSRPARIILNEVTSSASSTLNGPTEVFGSKAQIIIANPNGIDCVGCSFINSNRVTLSTGKPLVDFQRGDVKFDVSRGTVTVKGAGLLGMGEAIERVDLIGRQLKIEGPIQASDSVRLRTGAMMYDQRSDTANVKSVNGLPVVSGPAIHSSGAGKIIAGTLSVISRDVDVGVVLDGDLATYEDGIFVKSAGDASIKNAKTNADIELTAAGQVRLTGTSTVIGSVTASGRSILVTLDSETTANGSVVLSALQSLATRGILKSGSSISLVSGKTLVAEGLIAANGDVVFESESFTSKGLQISGRSVTVSGDRNAKLDNTEIVATDETIRVAGKDVELTEGTVFQAKNKIIVDAKGKLRNGTVLSYDNLDLTVRHELTNTASGKIILDDLILVSRDGLINEGLIYGRNKALLDAGQLLNKESGIIYGGDVELKISGELKNLGQIVSDRTFAIAAGDIVNNGMLQAETVLTVKAVSYKSLSGEAILAGKTADLIISGIVENGGQIVGKDRLSIAGGAIANDGMLHTDGALTVLGSNYSGGAGSEVYGKTIVFGKEPIAPLRAALSDGAEILLRTFSNKGKVVSAERLAIYADTVSNLGTESSIVGNTLIIQASGDITNEGTFGAIRKMTLSSRGNLTTPGSITVSGVPKSASEPEAIVEGNIELSVAGKITSGSDLVAAGNLKIVAGVFETAATAQVGGKNIDIDVEGALKSLGSMIAQDDLTIKSGSTFIGSTASDSTAGNLLAHSSITLMARSGNIENRGVISAAGYTGAGGVASLGNVSLIASGRSIINSGTIAANDKLNVVADSYFSSAVAQLGGREVVVRLTGEMSNLGFIAGSDLVDIEAKTLKNGPTVSAPATDPAAQAGQILAKTIKLSKFTSATNEGAIEASNFLVVTGGSLTNSGSLVANNVGPDGSVVGSPTATITLTGHLANSGSIGSGATLTLNTGSYTSSSSTALLTAKRLTMTSSGTVDNQGTILGSELLKLTSGHLINRGADSNIGGGASEIAGDGNAHLTVNGNLTNEGAISTKTFGDLNIRGNVMNGGSILSAGKLTLNAYDTISSSGMIAASGDLTIGVDNLDNALATSKIGGGSIALNIRNTLRNAGSIATDGLLAISGSSIINEAVTSDGSGILSGKTVSLHSIGSFVNRGVIQSASDLWLDERGAFNNTGKISALNELHVMGQSTLQNGGALEAKHLRLYADSYNGLSGSSLTAEILGAGNLGESFTNAGTVKIGNFNLTTKYFANLGGGEIIADNLDLTLWNPAHEGQVINNGKMAFKTSRFDISGTLTNAGEIESLGNIDILASRYIYNSGAIRSEGTLSLDAVTFSNRKGGKVEANRILIDVMDGSNRGKISAADTVKIVTVSGDFVNAGSGTSDIATIEANKVDIDVNGKLSNSSYALIHSGDLAKIKAASLSKDFLESKSTKTGLLKVENDLNLNLFGSGYSFDENINIAGSFTFTAAGDIVNNATITAGRDLTLKATNGGSITNGSNDPSKPGKGTLYAGRDIELTASGGDVNNYGAKIKAGGNITIMAGGEVRNVFVGLEATGRAALIQGGLSPVSGSPGTVKITAGGTLENRGSTISSFTDFVNIKAANFQNWSVGTNTAIIYGAQGVNISAPIQGGNGIVEGGTVTRDGKEITIPAGEHGGTKPDPKIDLTRGVKAIGATPKKGSAPAYAPASNAKGGSAKTRKGDKVATHVDATGKKVTVRNRDVVTDGTVSFLYATRVPANKEERNPSWILAQIGESGAGLTFYADPTTERELIQQALVQQIGRSMLDPKYRNPQEQQEALYQATVDFLRENPKIKLGDNLTDAQRAKIKKPILWYKWKTVDGKKVLVPELILPEKDLEKYAKGSGGAILAHDITIKADKVTNYGSILAVNTLTINAGTFLNERKLNAAGDGLLDGGVISAKFATIKTRGDLINRGGSIVASQGLTLDAKGDLRIETQKIVTEASSGAGRHWSNASQVKNFGAVVASGGDLMMKSNKQLSIIGSTVSAKGVATLYGAKGVTIESAIDESSSSSGFSKKGFLSKKSFAFSETTTTNLSSVVSAGTQLNVISKGDINITASHLSSKGGLDVLAGYNIDKTRAKGKSDATVNISAGVDGHATDTYSKKSGFGLFLSGGGLDFYRSKQMTEAATQGTNVASSLTAKGDINVKAKGDINIMGSTVGAKGFVNIEAGRDLNVGPGKNTSTYDYSKKEKGVGLSWSSGNGGFSIGAGYHAQSDKLYTGEATVAPSIIYGNKGVALKGRDVTITAAQIASKEHVEIRARRDLSILAGANTQETYQSTKQVFAGITLKISQNVSGAAQQLAQAPSTFNSGYGGAGYRTIGMISGTLQAVDAVKSLSSPYVGASLTIGASGSQSQSAAYASTAVGTTIKAGSLTLWSGRDMHLQGVQAKVKGDTTIHAERNLLIESAKSVTVGSSSSSSWSAGVGVYAGFSPTSGVSSGFTASGDFSRGQGSSWSETQLNTHIVSGGKTTIYSGKDTTIAGAVIKSKEMDVTVKGNLTVESRQDRSHNASSSVNGSLNVNIGVVGPSSVSVSGGGSRSSTDVAWVKEQTGLFSDGTMTVTVDKHTQINGGVLNSKDGTLKLDTGTLGFSDIKDHDTGRSVSGQAGVNTSGVPGQLPGVNVSGSYASHDIEQTTKATIGEGTIVIRDKDKQKQDVEDINRDADKTQVITKNESAGTQVYGSSDAVAEIASGFAGIKHNFDKLPEGLANLPQGLVDAVTQAAKSLNLAGQTPEQGAKALADALVKNGALKSGDKPSVDAVIEAWDDPAVRAAISACAGSGQTGFNLHDLIFTPAYAAGCGSIVIGGKSFDITKEGAQAVICVTAGAASGIVGKSLSFAIRALSSRGVSVLKDVLSADPTGGVIKTSMVVEGQVVSFDNHGQELYATLTVDSGPLATMYVLRKSGGDLILDSISVAAAGQQARSLSAEEFAAVAASQANVLAGAGIILPSTPPKKMLGENGVNLQGKSLTLWNGNKGERLDVENPDPGGRPGQVHYQDKAGNKYYYDPDLKRFSGAPRNVNKLLNDPKFSAAVDKAVNKYLGGW
jgi:filamentous hemagglutinin